MMTKVPMASPTGESMPIDGWKVWWNQSLKK